MPKYKLTYFDGRGLGEVSRWLFALADQPYDDVRFKYEDQKEWLAFKPCSFSKHLICELELAISTCVPRRIFNQSVNFSLIIMLLIAATPFGQLPLLEVDDFKLAQSNSIAQFLAHEFGT